MANDNEFTTEDILRQYGPQEPARPKDEHGFLFSMKDGQLKFNPWESLKSFMGSGHAPGYLSTSGNAQPIRDAFDTAGWIGLPGLGLNYAGMMPTNALGSAGGKLASKPATVAPRELDDLGFYSAALEGAKSWPMERGSPQQALAHLKKSGTKDAEIAATGLDKYLAEQDVISRQALENYLRENRVKLEENKYGGNAEAQEKWLEQARERELESMLSEYEVARDPEDGFWKHYLYGEPINEAGYRTFDRAEDELRYELEDAVRRMSDAELRERWFGDGKLSKEEEALWPQGLKGEAKWQEYALDTENPTYRESVMHLPEQHGPKAEYLVTPNGERFLASEVDPVTQRTLDKIGYVREKQYVNQNEPFSSGHWDEPNVVAHMRTSIQPDEAGRRTFLIDELQSDWGQKLREGGVRDEAKIANLKQRLAEAEAAYDKLDFHGMKFSEVMASPEARAVELLRAELRTAEAATPGHPLVNTTDQWTTTGIRRLLQQAAEADAAGIALTPGQLQNERFNLARHVAALRYSPDAQSLHYRQPGGTDFWYSYRGDVRPEDLPGIVGKDVAAELLKQPLGPYDGGGNYQAHVLHDLDRLEIGGSGMRYAYDQMYPKKIAKELKKLDPEHPGITQRRLQATDSMEVPKERRLGEEPVINMPFNYFELTPRAKEEIRKGLPLFQQGIPVADLLRAYYGDEKE